MKTVKYLIGKGSYLNKHQRFEEYDIYYFYPNNIWDDDKLSLKEALEKYPKSEFEWVILDD